MAQFGSEMPTNESGGAIEWAVSFRFPVSWDCLSSSSDRVQPRAALPIAPAAFVRSSAPVMEAQPPASRADRVAEPAAETQLGAKTEWGIVVPKMARSAGRSGQTLLSTAAEEPALATSGGGVSSVDPSFQTPSFAIAAESSWTAFMRAATFNGKAPLVAAAAVGVALLASAPWLRTKPPVPPAQTSRTEAAPNPQQSLATDVPVPAAPLVAPPATAIATPAGPPVAGAKSEKPAAKIVTASVTTPGTPTATRPVTPQRPVSPADVSTSLNTQSSGQAALARAATVTDLGETPRPQVPIAARTAEPVESTPAPATRAPAPPLPAPALAASATVSPAPTTSASSASEPQAAAQNISSNASPNTAPARTIAPAVPAPTVAVKTGGQLQQAQLISRKSPVYPALAQRARVEGSVVLDATVGTDGRLRNIRVLEGHPLLQSAAVDAVKQWVYKPATLNGTLTESDTHLVVTFGRNK